MAKKQKIQTDFTELDEVKRLILVNEQAHSNWMSGRPLITGNESYAKSNPEDWARLTNAYEKMNKALGNPPIKNADVVVDDSAADGYRDDGCCGGGCGCHEK